MVKDKTQVEAYLLQKKMPIASSVVLPCKKLISHAIAPQFFLNGQI